MKLRKLMDEPEIELRYGAFNALRTLDPHDPFLGLVRVIDEPKQETTTTSRPTRWRSPSLMRPAAAKLVATILSASTSSTRKARP